MDNATCANSPDFLVRGSINNLDIRFAFADTTKTTSDGIILHDTDPASSHYFGRALTSAILISPLLEGEEKYSLTWAYQGAMNSIVVDVLSNAQVRGITKTPHLTELASEEKDIYGDEGKISLIKSENGKILNSGVTEAGLLDVSDDIAMFFCISDQIETEIETAISFVPNIEKPVDIATGIMLQAMPNCNLLEFEKIRKKIKEPKFKELLLNKNLPTEKKTWKVFEYILNDGNSSFAELENDNDISYTFSHTPQYKCPCSYDKFKASLYTLGKPELEEIFKTQPSLNIKCEFCTKNYTFAKSDLKLG